MKSLQFRSTRDTALADIIGADARASRAYTRNNKNTPSGAFDSDQSTREHPESTARCRRIEERRQKYVVEKEREAAVPLPRNTRQIILADVARTSRSVIHEEKVRTQWEWRKWCPAVWLAWNICCSSSTWYSRWVTVHAALNVQGERRRRGITLRSLRCIRAAILGGSSRRRPAGRALFRVRISVKLLKQHLGIVDPSMLISATNFSHRYPFRSWAMNHFETVIL